MSAWLASLGSRSTEGCGRASECLKCVHIDIAGPIPVTSLGGRAYLLVVMDGYSRAVYSRPLRLKSEVAEAFKVFKALAETESGKKMREVLTDNARELSQGEMRRICEEAGIKLNTAIPYHPASNGIAERTIGVLTNAVCAMLHDSGLPNALWAEAFSAATYVRNRSPTSALKGSTPYEMVYDMKPDLANLRTFGDAARHASSLSRRRNRGSWMTRQPRVCSLGTSTVGVAIGCAILESRWCLWSLEMLLSLRKVCLRQHSAS